jgi:2,4-dienoyl-CoA reductase-like NADH-dependent reductase (Old Yellow Enzyme family)
MTPSLFDPLELRGVRMRNRIWVSPMCQYSVLLRDGVPTDWHRVHLGSLAIGRPGLVMTEATAVVPEGRISPEDTGIWNDQQADAWRPIVDFLHGEGTVAGIQLAHAGRKASTYSVWGSERHGTVPVTDGGWPTIGPSAIAFGDLADPRALETGELTGIVDAFVAAGRRAVGAGFDLVEVHAAHGYLLHQFLSPLSNLRDDDYGGSLENRARLLLEVVRGLRAELGESVPVMVRFSATDWADGGWDVEQTATVAAWARDAGADFFDISSGGLVAYQEVVTGPGYQVPFAEQVRRDAGVAVDAVGLITTPRQAADVIESGQADAVMLGRELLRDPHFPLRAAHELGVELGYWPPQYLRARWT